MKIKVYSDYVCPFCYIQKEVLRQIQEKYEVEVEYIPYELRRYPTPKVDPMNDEMRLQRFEEVIAPEAKRLGIEMKLPWMSPHPYSTLAFLGFIYAKSVGLEKEYNDCVYRSFYVEEKDISKKEVLKDIAQFLNMDVSVFEKALHNAQASTQLDRLFTKKSELGIQGIPAMEIEGNMVSGYHTFAQLEAIIVEEYTNSMQGMTCGINGCE